MSKNCFTLIEYYSDPPKTVYRSREAAKNPGKGKRFSFHGAFTHKEDAKKREAEIKGSFILEKNGRFYVLKEK